MHTHACMCGEEECVHVCVFIVFSQTLSFVKFLADLAS